MKRTLSALLCSGSLLSGFSAYASDDIVVAYAAPQSELMRLDNGVVLEGSDLSSHDTFTSGFRVTAGFSPWNLPQLDIGAELAYRESEDVPVGASRNPLLMDTLSLGGALVAGVRLGAVNLYAKSGLTEWRGDATSQANGVEDSGTAWLQGFGATYTFKRLVSRFEYERIDAPMLSHLNHVSASLHLPF